MPCFVYTVLVGSLFSIFTNLSLCEPLLKEIRRLFANDNYKRIKNDLYLGLNLPPLKGLGLKTLLDTFLFRDEEANDSQMIVLSIPPFFMISL